MRCLPVAAFAATLLMSSWIPVTDAAAPRNPLAVSKVDQVLQLELQDGLNTIDRRSLLKSNLDTNSSSDSARWQGGFVKAGTKWLPFDQISEESALPVLKEYRNQRNAAPKTAEGQLKLANWCRSQKLVEQERAHLSEMLTLAGPELDRAPIYRRMGYRSFAGQWISSAEYTAAQAQVRQLQAGFREWRPKLERIARDWEATPKQQQQAKESLNAIQDVNAIPAMLAASAGSRTLALAICDRLKEIDSFESSRALATIAVQSEWASVRDSAIDALRGRRLDDFVPTLLASMRSPFRVTTDSNSLVRPRIVFREEADRYLAIDVNMVPMIANVVRMSIILSARETSEVGRSSNDLIRNVAAIDHDIEQRIDEENECTDECNGRVAAILALLSGQELTSDPRFWWCWWQLYTGTVPAPKKCHIVRKHVPLPIETMYIRQKSCLIAGTPVQTERGLIAVEQIQVGDRVLSKDIETGELAYKPVLHTTERRAVSVKRLMVDGEAITASEGHHFWISGKGWVKAHELKGGEAVHAVTGTSRLTGVETLPEPSSVYNLVVADFHTYFVGPSLILSHDVLQPALTNTKVPGLQQAPATDD